MVTSSRKAKGINEDFLTACYYLAESNNEMQAIKLTNISNKNFWVCNCSGLTFKFDSNLINYIKAGTRNVENTISERKSI